MKTPTLPYHTSRNLIKDGDIIFIRNKGTYLHRLISVVTQSDQIHVGIAFWASFSSERHLMISEANGGTQRRIVNLSHYKDYDMDIVCGAHIWEDISPKALNRIGHVNYSWFKAGYVGIKEYWGYKFHKTLPILKFSGEICSEFVASVLGLDDTYLSPAHLYSHLVDNLGYKIRVHIRKVK